VADEEPHEFEVVPAAVDESNRRQRRRSALRDEVDRLAADAADGVARGRLMDDMEAVGLDWPQ
jgi:hypothetical protein